MGYYGINNILYLCDHPYNLQIFTAEATHLQEDSPHSYVRANVYSGECVNCIRVHELADLGLNSPYQAGQRAGRGLWKAVVKP